MQGIYKITNKSNGHCYIGSSVDIKKRWREHRARSVIKTSEQYKKSYYSRLYCAFRKYGRDNFDYDVLEIVENRDDLIDREKFWYFKYNPEYNNMVPDRVGVCVGVKHTEETKLKISKNNAKYWKDKKLPDTMLSKIIAGNETKRKKIKMIDIDSGEVLREFDGICNALRFLNKNPNSTTGITKCCKHIEGYNTCYGYKWEYDQELEKSKGK